MMPEMDPETVRTFVFDVAREALAEAKNDPAWESYYGKEIVETAIRMYAVEGAHASLDKLHDLKRPPSSVAITAVECAAWAAKWAATGQKVDYALACYAAGRCQTGRERLRELVAAAVPA